MSDNLIYLDVESVDDLRCDIDCLEAEQENIREQVTRLCSYLKELSMSLGHLNVLVSTVMEQQKVLVDQLSILTRAKVSTNQYTKLPTAIEAEQLMRQSHYSIDMPERQTLIELCHEHGIDPKTVMADKIEEGIVI